MIEAYIYYPQKINLWAVIINNKIIGPYFFEGTLTGEHYRAFLKLELILELATIFIDYVNLNLFSTSVWFQQNGTPSCSLRGVCEFLSKSLDWKKRGCP